jgi:hypothetical protein
MMTSPSRFFDQQIERLVSHAAAAPRRPGKIVFEVIGPEGGRWCLSLDKRRSTIERVDPYVKGDLLIRIVEGAFSSFADGSIDVVGAVDRGDLVLAGDLRFLDDLATLWRAPTSLLALRAKESSSR